MEQESSAEENGFTAADVMRVIVATIGVAVLSGAALFLLFAVMLGQAIGGVMLSVMGRSASIMGDGAALVWAIGIFVAQLGLSWFAASRIVPPARSRTAGRLAIGLSLLLCLIAVLGVSFLSHAKQARNQELNQRYQQRLAEEQRRRRADTEAQIKEMEQKLEAQKRELEESRKQDAALEAQKQKIIEDAKRDIAKSRARKSK